MKVVTFGKSNMFPLFVFGIGFKGKTTKSTSLVMKSCWSFCEGNSRVGAPKCTHHFPEITGYNHQSRRLKGFSSAKSNKILAL
nr:hypothetical protein CFP56_17583 [Quercus suber]